MNINQTNVASRGVMEYFQTLLDLNSSLSHLVNVPRVQLQQLLAINHIQLKITHLHLEYSLAWSFVEYEFQNHYTEFLALPFYHAFLFYEAQLVLLSRYNAKNAEPLHHVLYLFGKSALFLLIFA